MFRPTVGPISSLAEYASRPWEESIFLNLHARICSGLVPEWAGRWRTIEVREGNLRPALPHDVPVKMRDYALDLSFMRMGEGPHGPSWLSRTVALRDRFDPFRLETLLCAAADRASAQKLTASNS